MLCQVEEYKTCESNRNISCSNVDEPYFTDIAKSISKDADWLFYIHDGLKEKKYAEFASRIISQDGLEQVYSVVS